MMVRGVSTALNSKIKRTSYRCLFTTAGEVEVKGVTIRICCTMAGPPDERGQTLIQVAIKKSGCLRHVGRSCQSVQDKILPKRIYETVYYLKDESVMPPRTLSKRTPPKNMDPSLGKYWKQRQKLFTKFD